MPKPILILALLLPASGGALAAQANYSVRLGAIGATDLVRDAIISEITVRQSVAPMVALGGSMPIAPEYRLGLEAILSTGGYHSEENATDSDLGTLHTASLQLGLEGPIAAAIRWRVGAGALIYLPSDDAGIFLQGGTTRFLAGAGVDWRRPLHPRWDFVAAARYDFHRFTTDELERRGFSQTQGVSRASLSVGVARGLR